VDIRGGPQAAGAPPCQADGPRSADLHLTAAGVTMPTRLSRTPSGWLPTYTAVHKKPARPAQSAPQQPALSLEVVPMASSAKP